METLLRESVNSYKSVLLKEPHNIYALMGLGTVLAHSKFYAEAREIFSHVRECAPDCVDAYINLAHVYVHETAYVSAINLYKQALNKFFNGVNAELCNYLGHCYYEAGMFKDVRGYVHGCHIR